MKCLLLIPFLVACSGGNNSVFSNVGDGGANTTNTVDSCRLVNAQYRVVFTETSGDCQSVGSVAEGAVWTDGNGNPIYPDGCVDNGVGAGSNPYTNTDVCTTHQTELCWTWATNVYMDGDLAWSTDKQTGTGDLEFNVYSNVDGHLVCSSMYHTVWSFEVQELDQ